MADILELAPTFRSLADAYAAATACTVGGALETGDGDSETEGGAGFSRLAVGLAVRQASRAEQSRRGFSRALLERLSQSTNL